MIDPASQRANDPAVLSGIHIQLARLAAGLTQQQLADEANLGVATIRRAEAAKANEPPLTYSNILAIRRTLESRGITFIEDDPNPGIRWRSTR